MAKNICPVCQKNMPAKVLSAHLVKRHPEYQPTPIEPTVPTVAVEEPSIPTAPIMPGVETSTVPTVEPAPTPVPEGMVVFRAADNRELEVSIGDRFWKGKEITVPKDQAMSVRRILLQAGYFLKE